MSTSLLQNRIVQRAVAQVALRAERQEDVGQLVDTFVDPGVSVQLDNENNQILYGRRGTGKTHVLKVVEKAAKADEFVLYVDMRTLGSSSIFSDDGRPMHVRVTALLRDVLALLENSLLEWATRPDIEVPGPVFEALDALATAISRSILVDATLTTDERSSEESRSGSDADVTVGGASLPSLSISAREEIAASRAEATTRTGRELNPVYFQEISEALEAVRQAAGLKNITLLLDEWTSIPLDLQPLLAEFLKRSFFPLPRVTVKIASLEYRSNFSAPLERNNVLGFELGADISSTIELDDYYVYDRNADKTIAMFGELLYRHVAAEATNVYMESDPPEETLLPDYLAEAYGIARAEIFVRNVFASPDAFRELVRAGEGVARDFINIFSAAFFASVRRDRSTIDIKAVQEAAREWYEKDKSQNVDDEQGRVLRMIIEEVIAQRKARSFLLEKEYEKEPVILSLFDYRVLHLVQRGYADKDNPGVRYNIYTLDYGTYVDLIGTQSAPTGDFTEGLRDDDTIVPFDDRRSIRRIILRPEQLRAAASERADGGAVRDD